MCGCWIATATAWPIARSRSGAGGVTGYVDTDGDGRWDVKLTDTDGDGAADAASALAPKT